MPFLLGLIPSLLGLLFPKAPSWIAQVLTHAVPSVIAAVRHLKETQPNLSGEEKKQAAIKAVRDVLDESLDTVPGWCDLAEEERDKLIDALVEASYFVVKHESHAQVTQPDKMKENIIKKIGDLLAGK